jgi:hypothetical protein
LYIQSKDLDKVGITQIKSLRDENWRLLNSSEKVGVLQDCENRISSFEERSSATVRADIFSTPSAGINIDASYTSETSSIKVSEELLYNGSAYDAFKALAHESFHAYQIQAIENPGFHKNKEQVEEWKEGFNRYEKDRSNWELYKLNSFELPAFFNAQSLTEQLQSSHQTEKSQGQLSAKVLVVEERPDKDPLIWVQFGDTKPRGYTVKGFQSGDNLYNIEISGDFISKLENLKQGEIAEAKLLTQTVKDDKKLQNNSHHHQIERDKEGEKER